MITTYKTFWVAQRKRGEEKNKEIEGEKREQRRWRRTKQRRWRGRKRKSRPGGRGGKCSVQFILNESAKQKKTTEKMIIIVLNKK